MRVNDFQHFLDNSPSPFHAVQQCSQMLQQARFTCLLEHESWKLNPNGKYFFTKNSSTIVAFCIGSEFKAGNGFAIVGAHTDSPCLKVKPITKAKSKHSFLQVGLQTYGGGLWHTWFDRDLSLAGRVLHEVQDKKDAKIPTLRESLVFIDRPLLKIPSLAIHLNRTVDSEGFKFNKETHLVPIAGMASEDSSKDENFLLDLVAKELEIEATSIKDVELSLFDCQKAAIGGLNGEFIFSARLDNLLMSFCSLQAFIDEFSNGDNHSSQVSMLVLFDHEEVGSLSAQGADSSLLSRTIDRIVGKFFNSEEQDCFQSVIQQSIARSLLVSADCAHSVHPNYAESHEESHRPVMNGGVVLKVNANQRYATNGHSGALIKQLANKHSVPLQEFCVKNDSGCGTTIGPIISGNLSIKTVDIGNPQLSMHSIRETAGTLDIEYAIRLLRGFYSDFDNLSVTF